MYLGRNYSLQIHVDETLQNNSSVKLFRGKFHVYVKEKNDELIKTAMEAWYREKTEEQVAEVRVHHERVQIPEDEATSIFVSIGKNRRVFPRDLVGLLIAVGGLERDRIGDIKVLANYSFVQLYANDARTAIDKLNGYDYRGRKLAVSFSRQKSDDDLADDSDVNEIAEDQYSEEDTEMSAEDAAAYAAAEKAASDKEPFGLN